MKKRMVTAILLCIPVLCVNAHTLVGHGDSPEGALDTVAPLFANLTVTPALAAPGCAVTISFSVTKELETDPAVLVNGQVAPIIEAIGSLHYVCEYEVTEADTLGMAVISIAGQDALGNEGNLVNNTALEIVAELPILPLRLWPAALAVLAVVAGVLVWRRRYTALACLFAAALLAAVPVALAQTGPTVSNVSFEQEPAPGGGTRVLIRYDLDAPDGPCDIVVLLSKDGGVNFNYPVTSISGDISNVTSDTQRAIVWDIATDYPNESIPSAVIRVVAVDTGYRALVYTSEPGGALVGDTFQVVPLGADGTQVIAVPDSSHHFLGWSDGVSTMDRVDTNVQENTVVTARFAINTYTLIYLAGENGAISGLSTQTVNYGANGAFVTAHPNPGYRFVQWSDERTDNPRTDLNVTANLTVTALFELDAPDPEGEGEPPGDGPEMVSVPAGSFEMGRPCVWDPGWGSERINEVPVHTVTLDAYRIGKYPVTNQEYADVLNWALAEGHLKDSGGNAYTGGLIYAYGQRIADVESSSSWSQITYSGGVFGVRSREGHGGVMYSMADHPMVMVSWYGSVAFCNWLSAMQGLQPVYNTSTWERIDPLPDGYRLPTEAEWERAAAWDGTKHWRYGMSSDTLDNTRANYWAGSYVNPLGLMSIPYTSPVGWFNGVNISPNGSVQTVNAASPVGAYDMCGNVAEWCHDWWLRTYTTDPVSSPTGPATGTHRLLRGGSWLSYDHHCRAAIRYYNVTPVSRNYSVGFRILRTP